VLDDMIDTAGTLCAAGDVLFSNGAKDVMACATHAVFSGPAIDRINASHFSKIIVSDTIPQNDKLDRCHKLTCLSMAGLLARSIHNIHTGSSVSVLFV